MKCPNCGTDNRAAAKFCARCRTRLTSAKTMKVCPQCSQQNRVGAKFCANCGRTFASQTAHDIPRRNVYAVVATIVGLVIVVGLFAGRDDGASQSTASATLTPAPIAATDPSGTPSSGPTPTLPERLDRALLATVQLIVPVDGQRESSAGSGSVLTEQGHILTNFHVVGDPDTGRPHNREGVIYVAISPRDLKDPPEIQYVAELMEADQRLDLALIKIIARSDGRQLPVNPSTGLKTDLNLITVPVGDSDTVKIGDELSIIGFPGLGGATVTFTKGSVSGFLTEEGWIKTDAEINPGNSGGSAINRDGQLVGIPSAAATETVELPGKIGLVRPVNLARPLIDLAMSDARARP